MPRVAASEREALAVVVCLSFFFNDTATTEIYTLSLHDALPIWDIVYVPAYSYNYEKIPYSTQYPRSEEHTSELQSRQYLVCRLLLEKNYETTTFAASFDACYTSRLVVWFNCSL